jgi:hypothetical protein
MHVLDVLRYNAGRRQELHDRWSSLLPRQSIFRRGSSFGAEGAPESKAATTPSSRLPHVPTAPTPVSGGGSSLTLPGSSGPRMTDIVLWVLGGEIYKMNPLCPRKWDYEPIVPQGTHFVSSAS